MASRPLAAGLVFAFAITLLQAVPTVSAHVCSADNPEASCGDCASGQAHDHRHRDGSSYCYSTGPSPIDLPYIGDLCESCQTLIDMILKLIGDGIAVPGGLPSLAHS